MRYGADLGYGARNMGIPKITDEFDQTKQFETIAAIRAYADKIQIHCGPNDLRPSTAKNLQSYVDRMKELADTLYARG